MLRSLTLSALAASIIIPASAHSWIEEYQVIGPNGSYIGDRGFSRGYIGREDPDFDGSLNSVFLIPSLDARMPDGTTRLRMNSTDSICRPNQQTSNYTNSAYPMLQAAPGDYIAMKYLENGHVTLPWNQPGKPLHGGTVYVFGTTKPKDDEKLATVMEWTKDGKGGDGRGQLLTTQNFDDNRCHQINDCTNSVERQGAYPNTIPGQPGSVSELWCETDVKLPQDLAPGTYTTYWVWQWPTEPGTNCGAIPGKDEYYTTCADHKIIAKAADDEIKLADAPLTNTLPGEDFTSMAVSTYKEREAYTTHPVILDNWANYNVKAVTTMDHKVAAFASACATTVVPTGVPPACPNGKWATGSLAAFYSSKGRASAASAESAWKAKAKATTDTSSSAPAASPTRQPKGGDSPSVTVTRVKSIFTTWYTSTITGTPTKTAGHDRPDRRPHRGPSDRQPENGGGYITVTTEGRNQHTSDVVGASQLNPGHDYSTNAADASPTHDRQSDLIPADISGISSSSDAATSYTTIDFVYSSPLPVTTGTLLPNVVADASSSADTSSLAAASDLSTPVQNHVHSSGCRHKSTTTAPVPIKHVRTTASASHRRHARQF